MYIEYRLLTVYECICQVGKTSFSFVPGKIK